MKNFQKKAFSLMEMMIVLLITAIVVAATAPMITKKISRGNGSSDSPWIFTGLNDCIAYNLKGNDNSTVVIGRSILPNTLNGKTRLFIDSGNNASHIAFGNGENKPLQLTADPANGRIGFSNEPIKNRTVSFGAEQDLRSSYERSIIIGNSINKYEWHWDGSGSYVDPNANTQSMYNAYKNEGNVIIGDAAYMEPNSRAGIAIGARTASNLCSVVVGAYSSLLGDANTSVLVGASTAGKGYGSVAVGYSAEAATAGTALGQFSVAGENAIAIGSGHLDNVNNSYYRGARALGDRSIALGVTSEALNPDSIAIGTYAKANYEDSVAIGNGVETKAANQIVLGTNKDTVVIPGNLVVDGDVLLASTKGKKVYLQDEKSTPLFFYQRGVYTEVIGNNKYIGASERLNYVIVGTETRQSDRRLKNVGEKYTAGLEELKKLDFFHYTFKKDENKTPRVGVMAQDLQKVFPDAVVKGEDGYLLIRTEDMFYAVINAVKELDSKISALVEKVDSIVEDITTMKVEIIKNIEDINSRLNAQDKMIEKQQAEIKELRLMLEKQKQEFSKK